MIESLNQQVAHEAGGELLRDESVQFCVNLHGALTRTDTLYEAVLQLLKNGNPALLKLPFWLLRGRAFLKAEVAMRVDLDPAWLPHYESLLEYLAEPRAAGRTLVPTIGSFAPSLRTWPVS